MTRRSSWVGMVLLAVMTPPLLFPALVGAGNAWVAVAIAVVALAGAVVMLGEFGRLRWPVAVFAMMVLAGWLRAGAEEGALNHLCGVALGLLAMATVATWCRTPDRLVLATLAFLLAGALALDVGVRSTAEVARGKALFRDATASSMQPAPLPLASLHGRMSVNRNAVAATALLILPVAIGAAAAATPARLVALQIGARLASLLSMVWAAVVILMMQSRSVWMSVAVLLWIQVRRFVGPVVWGMSTVAGVALPVIAAVFWGDHPRVADTLTSLLGRLTVWQDAVAAWRGAPWLGIGLDQFRHLPWIAGGSPHAHNIFLQSALDIGLIGLFAYLGVLWGIMRCALDVARSTDVWSRRVGLGAALSVVAVHVYGLLDAVALGTKVGVFQWLSCGLVLAAWRWRTDTATRRETT